MSYARFDEYKNTFYSYYDSAKTRIADILESETAVRAKSIMDGAVKSALGVHYLFDLGLSCIPATSAAYNVFRGIKYTVTGITFLAASYRSYDKERTDKNNQEKLNHLEDNLQKANQAIIVAEKLIAKCKELIAVSGYPFHQNDISLQLDDDLDEKTPTNQAQCEQVNDSQPALQAKSFLDGAIKASAVYYILELCTAFIADTHVYKTTTEVIVILTFLLATLNAYHARNAEQNAKNKLEKLETKMLPAYAKLQKIEKIMGSRSQLKKIAKESEQITQQPVHLGVPEKKEPEKSAFTQFCESKQAMLLRSCLNGAVTASGIHYIAETLVPQYPIITYVLALTTLLGSSYRSYAHMQKDLQFEHKLEERNAELKEKQDILTMANKILTQYEIFLLKSKRRQPEEMVGEFKEDPAAEKCLSTDLNDLMIIDLPAGIEIEMTTLSQTLVPDDPVEEKQVGQKLTAMEEGMSMPAPLPADTSANFSSYFLDKFSLFKDKSLALFSTQNTIKEPLLKPKTNVSYGSS